MINHYPQNQLTLFSVISSLYLDIYTHYLNFMCLHCLSFRWITGRSATRVVKGSSSQCHVAAAPSLCSCHAAAQSLCMPSTQESWSRCSGATTTTSTAASFTRTTRWDALKSQGGDCCPSSLSCICLYFHPYRYFCLLCQSGLAGLKRIKIASFLSIVLLNLSLQVLWWLWRASGNLQSSWHS